MTTPDASNNDRPRLRPVPAPKVVLCPFCGGLSPNLDLCTHCKGRFDPLSRQASQNAMGPWFIRDDKNPFAPGCSFETVRMLISRGRIQPNTILRGPSTNQFWTLAKRAPSIASLLSLCHNCQARVDPKDFACGTCGAAFTPEPDRQHLGLAPLQHLPGQAPPAVIAALSGPPIGFDPVEVTRYGKVSAIIESPSPTRERHVPLPASAYPSPRRTVSNRGDDTRTWLLLGGAMLAVILLGAVFGPDLARRLASDDTPPRLTQSPIQGNGAPSPRATGPAELESTQNSPAFAGDNPSPTPRDFADGDPAARESSAVGGSNAFGDRFAELVRVDTRESLETAREMLRTVQVETPEWAGLRDSIDRRLRRESVRRLP